MAKDPRSKQQLEPEEARALIRQLDRRTFQEDLARLTQGFSSDAGNPGSYACENCTRCASSMFCKGCDSCYQCNYCIDCELCNNCTHCVGSKQLHGCAYSVQSENCTNSAYVVLSRNLSDCTYCFGCVGLTKKDFYILNVPFDRKEYFEVTKKLRRELDLK